jgi:ethanolamine utilization protein EutN
MEVDVFKSGSATGDTLIAVDAVGAGIGEDVIITLGSSARLALHKQSTPTDAVIVGIIDQR